MNFVFSPLFLLFSSTLPFPSLQLSSRPNLFNMMASGEEDSSGEFILEKHAKSANESSSPDSPDVNDIFGNQQVLPRVGDQYQADIPPLLTAFDLLQLLKNPTDQGLIVDNSHSFLLGLPIPVVWVHDKSYSTKNEALPFYGAPDGGVKKIGPAEFENGNERNINLKNGDSRIKDEPLYFASDGQRGLGDLASSELTALRSGNDVGLNLLQHDKLKQEKYKWVGGYSLAPGSLSNSLSDFEQQAFLLGVYIFGKNLIQVKKFVGSKGMGDILSHYYGKFYKSDEYKRWLECRKIRSKRCIHGIRMFTGWRLQELLSRLFRHVSGECQNTLIEVSRKFEDAKSTLEEYVRILKAKVGVSLLIEAVGIGKGKQDLTGMVTEPLKVNQVFHTRPEIPVGKACSSLSSGEIIRLLTGDFRLSKARSNDLFWEAVWPRLLAKGWRSELPKNARSKDSLVFLIPGIKKFSRRKLLKAYHYYDCVTDVLKTVASEPYLIQLDEEQDSHCTKKELKKDCHFGYLRQPFLQPPVSNINPDVMKFTVVDTSIIPGEEPLTVTKLRKLPVSTTRGSASRISRKDDGDKTEEFVHKLDSTGILSTDHVDTIESAPSEHISGQLVCADMTAFGQSILKKGRLANGSECRNAPLDCVNDGSGIPSDKNPDKLVPVDIRKDSDASMSNKNQSRLIKCQFSRRRKHDQSNNLIPFTKRRRLTACSQDDATHSKNRYCLVSGGKDEDLHLDLDACNGSGSMLTEAGTSYEKVSEGSSAKDGRMDSTENGLRENCFGTKASPENNPPRSLFDLNLPHFEPDSEYSGKCTTEMGNGLDSQSMNGSSFPPETIQLEDSQVLKTSSQLPAEKQHPVTVARRQSTRNRPLTAKALEALACGLLTNKRKWRGTEPVSEENWIPKPSRRRGKVSTTKHFGDIPNLTVDSRDQHDSDDECGSETNIISGPQVLTGSVL